MERVSIKDLGFFALGEWGTYKGGGPGYTVFSAGLVYSLMRNVEIKLTYSTYTVAGGTVTTSSVSGIQLGDARLLQVQVEANW